jgi:hypothetical protein
VSHPDDDTLAGLALGEPAPPEVAEHVRGCASCSEALASLRDTITTLRAPVPELLAPPVSVWDAVGAEIDAGAGERAAPTPTTTVTATMTTTSSAGAMPTAPAPGVDDDLARQRAIRGTTGDRRGSGGRRRFPLAWVAGAAAAGLVIGVIGARAVDGAQGDPVDTVATTRLDTLDTQQAKGTADVVRHDGRLDLTVSTQPIDPDGGYLEVWLINKDLKRMVSVGVLEPGEDGQSFAIPQELLDQGYVIVDISREGFDDAPEHSGDSVVRGTLKT